MIIKEKNKRGGEGAVKINHKKLQKRNYKNHA